MLDQHLGRAEDVSRGVKRDARVAAMHRLCVWQLDAFLREALAEPAGHDGDGVRRGHDFRMPGPGVIGMAVRDDRGGNGPDGVDEEVSGLAVKPFGADLHPVAGITHSNRQNVRLNCPSLVRLIGRARPVFFVCIWRITASACQPVPYACVRIPSSKRSSAKSPCRQVNDSCSSLQPLIIAR